MSRSAFSSIVTRCHAKYDPMSLSVAYTTLLFARFACVLARWVFVFFIFQTMIFHTSILLYKFIIQKIEYNAKKEIKQS